MEKISIVVPIYNAKTTLERCIKSLINQTYKNIEIILVNDGSTDESVDICSKYFNIDKRIRVINKSNGGVSSARNAGMRVSTGKYIMFCDSDDYAYDNWCECLASSYKEGYLLMSGYDILDGDKVWKNIVPNFDGNVIDKKRFMELKWYGFFSPWNKIYKAKTIKDNQILFDEKLSKGEDLLFNLQYLSCIENDISFVKKSLYAYSKPNDRSLSNNVTIKNWYQIKYLYNCIVSILIEHRLFDKMQISLLNNHMYNEIEKILYLACISEKYGILKKIKIVNSIMESKMYRECIKHVKFNNKIYYFCCNKKNGYLLILFYKLRELIKNEKNKKIYI